MTTSGEQCVMMIGTSEMHRWCAESWTAGQLRQPNQVPTLVKAKETSGWMMSTVRETRRPFCTANIPPLEKITVAMAKMPAWCAQVYDLGYNSVELFLSLSFFFFTMSPIMSPMNILLLIVKNCYIRVHFTSMHQSRYRSVFCPEVSKTLTN